ncbi:hypothetical protein ACFL1H_01495 [Nanoarchaeota archaeon]
MKINEIIYIGVLVLIAGIVLLGTNVFDKSDVIVSGISGGVTYDELAGGGCCMTSCQYVDEDDCVGDFVDNKQCSELEECNIGCCVMGDYCYANYLGENCNNSQGKFINYKECADHFLCLTEPEIELMLGDTGYPYIFERNTKGISFNEPTVGRRGDLFFMQFYVFNESEENVKMQIFSNRFTRTSKINMYDDGSHYDGQRDDYFYGARWNSGEYPVVQGIEKIYYQVLVNDENGTLEPDYFLLTENDCMPMLIPFEEDRKSVFLIASADTEEIESMDNQIEKTLGDLVSINFTSFEEMNWVKIDYLYDRIDWNYARNRVKDECEFFKANDFVIFLDNDFDYCTQYGSNDQIIKVSPNFIVLNYNYSNQKDFLEEFCNSVTTPQQIQDIIGAGFSNITIIEPSVVDFNDYEEDEIPEIIQTANYYENGLIEIVFLPGDPVDEELPYKIYYNRDDIENRLASGMANVGVEKSIKVNLPGGIHSVWVELNNSREFPAYSDIVVVNINYSNFYVNILNLENYSYEFSPDINFTMSHDDYSSVNYQVIVDGIVKSSGPYTIGTNESVNVNMVEGEHLIKVIGIDGDDNKSESYSYLIKVEGTT